ncbi:hypothetical protein HPB48_013112 [Haemaphysalis longicornis]|uniref:Uncharacterized protein n=1 Tax=Haemaphysalis longicornis TaxID=44386 RepID=A0A9J6GJR3_HAELO|nr:hypothetical protein HPB48_013112 [Haemaphysalis longicornis]
MEVWVVSLADENCLKELGYNNNRQVCTLYSEGDKGTCNDPMHSGQKILVYSEQGIQTTAHPELTGGQKVPKKPARNTYYNDWFLCTVDK